MTDICAPVLDNSMKIKGKQKTKKRKFIKESCLPADELVNLVKAWNKHYKEDQISLNQSYQILYSELKSKFNGDSEIFWFENDILKNILDISKIDELKNKYYKPLAPEKWHDNPSQWLSNFDIEAVLERYEDKYPEFKSYGATPIDFAQKSGNYCLINSICNFTIKDMIAKNKNKIGIVINLDKSGQSGSHWIALYVDLTKSEINFWDSVATEPPSEVVDLMNKIEKDINKNIGKIIKEKAKIQINKTRHQYENNECGMYSLHFIISQLEGGSFSKVCKNIINDSKMNAMRKEYFILQKPKTKKRSLFDKIFS